MIPTGFRIVDPRDPFEVAAGPFYAPVSETEPLRMLLVAEERHCNASGVVHGGLLATMADVTVCYAAIRGLPGERAVTISLTADFVAFAVRGDILEARAEVTRRTGSLVFARGAIAVGEKPILTCSAVIKRMRRG